MDYTEGKKATIHGFVGNPDRHQARLEQIDVKDQLVSFCTTENAKVSVPAVKLLTILSKTGRMSADFDSIISDKDDIIKRFKDRAIALKLVVNGIVPEEIRKTIKNFLLEDDSRESIYSQVEIEMDKIRKAPSR